MQLQYDPPLATPSLPNPFLQMPASPKKTSTAKTAPNSIDTFNTENVRRLLEANSDCV